jgi:hypothetical protein
MRKKTSNTLQSTNRRNGLIIGIGLLIVLGVTIWTVYRFMSMLG